MRTTQETLACTHKHKQQVGADESPLSFPLALCTLSLVGGCIEGRETRLVLFDVRHAVRLSQTFVRVGRFDQLSRCEEVQRGEKRACVEPGFFVRDKAKRFVFWSAWRLRKGLGPAVSRQTMDLNRNGHFFTVSFCAHGCPLSSHPCFPRLFWTAECHTNNMSAPIFVYVFFDNSFFLFFLTIRSMEHINQ